MAAKKKRKLEGTDCFGSYMYVELSRNKNIIRVDADDGKFCFDIKDLLSIIEELTPKRKDAEGTVSEFELDTAWDAWAEAWQTMPGKEAMRTALVAFLKLRPSPQAVEGTEAKAKPAHREGPSLPTDF